MAQSKGNKAAGKKIKHAALERFMHYYHCLTSPGLWDGDWVTSSRIAYYFNMDDTQVRKDMAQIGVKGMPRQGFKRSEVIESIRHALGLDKRYKAAVVGAGRLGGAIMEYRGYSSYGLEIAAVFDVDPAKLGTTMSGCRIYPTVDIVKVCRIKTVSLGILTCPAEVAQRSADLLVQAGVYAIWNFSTTNLIVPGNVFVRNEHISVGLAELAYFMNRGSGSY